MRPVESVVEQVQIPIPIRPIRGHPGRWRTRFVVDDRDESALEEMGAVQRLPQHGELGLVSDISDADVANYQHRIRCPACISTDRDPAKRTGGPTPIQQDGNLVR